MSARLTGQACAMIAFPLADPGERRLFTTLVAKQDEIAEVAFAVEASRPVRYIAGHRLKGVGLVSTAPWTSN